MNKEQKKGEEKKERKDPIASFKTSDTNRSIIKSNFFLAIKLFFGMYLFIFIMVLILAIFGITGEYKPTNVLIMIIFALYFPLFTFIIRLIFHMNSYKKWHIDVYNWGIEHHSYWLWRKKKILKIRIDEINKIHIDDTDGTWLGASPFKRFVNVFMQTAHYEGVLSNQVSTWHHFIRIDLKEPIKIRRLFGRKDESLSTIVIDVDDPKKFVKLLSKLL